ncbi:MAG: hypothetical protein KGL42_00740, partial [Betaproteobacteria bacterium]|nr:hypothetical protein [Betaproteobacteria bacterium]
HWMIDFGSSRLIAKCHQIASDRTEFGTTKELSGSSGRCPMQGRCHIHTQTDGTGRTSITSTTFASESREVLRIDEQPCNCVLQSGFSDGEGTQIVADVLDVAFGEQIGAADWAARLKDRSCVLPCPLLPDGYFRGLSSPTRGFRERFP